MRILITNDDGIQSPGLAILKKALEKDHEVWAFAPDRDRSGVSHSLTLRRPVRSRDLGDSMYSCSGTPVDCIIMTHHGALGVRPDLVISGINLGANLGSDLIYSGTAAAARQAAIMGYPSIAVSIDATSAPWHFGNAVAFVEKNLGIFACHGRAPLFFNINVPNQEEACTAFEFALPANLNYSSSITSFEAPDGELYHFYRGCIEKTNPPPGTDWDVLRRGKISISTIAVMPTTFRDGDLIAKLECEMR